VEKLKGSYSLRSAAIKQIDYQIEPQHWKAVEGFKLPIRGPFTQLTCDRGTAVLYVSQPGEVPLYYSVTPGWIHWHEQKLALPGSAKRVNQGECVVWSPKGVKTIKAEDLSRPAIVPAVACEEAIAQYQQQIIDAVSRRLGGRSRVAVSQSGGVDSLLITWALLRLGIEVVSLVVCTGMDDPDISIASEVLPQMGLTPDPVLIPPGELRSLCEEAAICFENPDVGNLKMAIGNLLMARRCKELEIDLIFNGHAQDDLHGVGGLALGSFKKLTGTPSERWRDARRKEVHDATGMVKMFASTFRRYGVEVRMPYYDADLIEWALSQPVTVVPVHHAKPFVRLVACASLPPGPWMEQRYNSTGYITGAGFYEDRLRDTAEASIAQARSYLAQFKQLGYQKIAELHAQINPS
jgi:asparagine synthetase B (glutamine-hydrolysing)